MNAGLPLVIARPVTDAITITVHGTPAPQGSKKGFVVGKRAVLVESSAKVKPWRQAVVHAALAQLPQGWTALDGPLVVEMIFTLRKPASAPKRRRTFPDRTPDLSKLVRATEDALTDAGVWADDARVVSCRAVKCFPREDESRQDTPGVVVHVRRHQDAG